MPYTIVKEEDHAFHRAYSNYVLAQSDNQRSAASLVLRTELERQSLSLDEALKRQKAAHADEFARELALLETHFRQADKREEDAAAMRKAVVELCLSKVDSDPDEAALLAKSVLSWSVQWTPLESCGSPFTVESRQKIHYFLEGPARPVLVRLAQMTPQELQRVSSNAQQLLKKKGQSVPIQHVQYALSGSVKMEETRRSDLQFWTEALGWVSGACSVVTTAVTTVEAIKSLPMNPDMVGEPLLNCRHYVPDGWYF